jgi:hypothetical protein
MMYARWLALAAVLGCEHEAAFPTARFANVPPVTVVDDRRDVPRPPAVRLSLLDSYSYDVYYERQVTRALEVPRHQRARGVNSADEVPDSTWFTNRSSLSPEQVRTGPLTLDNPELHTPWTIHSTSYGGSSLAFIVRDARGVKYLVKFDEKELPEMESGIDVVVDRLLWATGFNVPEDQVVYVRPQDLAVAPDARIIDKLDDDRGRLDHAEVERRLAQVAHERDGRIRGSASRWLDGKALGGSPAEGVRADDPNDRIAHELRRDLRGMSVVYAWLDMVDVWQGNFLDMWQADPSEPNRHYVKHYMLDFGLSMGGMGSKKHDLRRGYVYQVDYGSIFGSLFTAGLVQQDFETRPHVQVPGVAALFTATNFDPGSWHADYPYLPFQEMDRFDAYWGAKLVAQLTREQIHAAVEAGRFSDPRAVEYLTDTLVARQRKTAAYWYARVNPLDHFSAGYELCFDDLAVAQRYVPWGVRTIYSITARDQSGRAIAAPVWRSPERDGHVCTGFAQIGGPRRGYTIFEVTTMRSGFRGTTYVHVVRDAGVRVIGIWRV